MKIQSIVIDNIPLVARKSFPPRQQNCETHSAPRVLRCTTWAAFFWSVGKSVAPMPRQSDQRSEGRGSANGLPSSEGFWPGLSITY